MPHAQPWLLCLGFRLEADGKCLAYSGDARLCAGIERLSKNADLLIHWCYRSEGQTISPQLDARSPTPSLIAQMSACVGVKRLLSTHIRVQMDEPAARAAALGALQDHFPREAGIAEDLDQITL
ncbi:MAG: hypothetical protein MK180_03920 [Rhodobacteraceae bacterium]|nr:hypothetical protein [Paracoccaceae bacterium]